MVGSHEHGTSIRKSARLEKKRQTEFGESSQGTDLNSRFQFTTDSEGELIVVTPEEKAASSSSSDPSQEEWSED